MMRWLKVSAKNLAVWIVAAALTWLVFTAYTSFVAWGWEPVTDSRLGRALFGLAALWWASKAATDGPFDLKGGR